MIEKDPLDASLETHALKGSLKGKLSVSLNYEYRIIFHDIGSHDEVY